MSHSILSYLLLVVGRVHNRNVKIVVEPGNTIGVSTIVCWKFGDLDMRIMESD